LPAPSSVYEHFHSELSGTLTRLKSLDQIEPYLRSEIELHPEIIEGAVLAIDAVSCSNTFVGMKTVEEGKVAYLFVACFQPLTPAAKCSPLYVMESQSGMADDRIQRKLDELFEKAGVISPVFSSRQMVTVPIMLGITSSWNSGSRSINNGAWSEWWRKSERIPKPSP
jgi:hypothetical protein